MTAQAPGCQQLEWVFFGLKHTLIELHIGTWATDDLLVYIAESLRNLELIEINSSSVNDFGVTALFRRCHKLTVVDLSGCENFVGVSFTDSMTSQSDVDMDWDKTLRHLRRLTLGAFFTGSAKHSIA